MCRMFGFRSAVPSRAHRSLVAAENALAAQSQRHPDGWGIGWFVDDDAYVIKSSNAAHASDRFERASTVLTSHTFLVHVRRATVGDVDPLNAHPFRFGRWLFCHNGTLFGFDQLGPWLRERTHPDLDPLVLGDTDSERLFFWLLTRLDAAGLDRAGRTPSDARRVAEVVRASLFELDAEATRRGLERPICNVLLTDGRLLVGHKAGMPLFLSSQKHQCSEFEVCKAPKWCMEAVRPADGRVNHLLVASEPIASDENRWEPLADGTTLALADDMHLAVLPPPPGWVAPEVPERYRALAAADGQITGSSV